MKTVKLRQILSPEQVSRVRKEINSSTSLEDATKRLKVYFGTFKDDLERQGILSDFLAYATAFALHNKMKKKHEPNKNSKRLSSQNTKQ